MWFPASLWYAAPSKRVCAEREKLEKAYRDAQAQAHDLFNQLEQVINTAKPNVAKEAKKRVETAERRAAHIRHELGVHERDHDCAYIRVPR
jgi:phage shock protein A